jgi:hypothetical protein
MKAMRFLFTRYLIFLGATTISGLIFPLKPVDRFVVPLILVAVGYFVNKQKKRVEVKGEI